MGKGLAMGYNRNLRCHAPTQALCLEPMSEPSTTTAALPRAHQDDALLRLIADSVPSLMAYYELPRLQCRFANQGYAAYNGH